ncbi:response regulator [bacterium AH-315-P07]|nr:response regulator [bacterium AH-315-P07]
MSAFNDSEQALLSLPLGSKRGDRFGGQVVVWFFVSIMLMALSYAVEAHPANWIKISGDPIRTIAILIMYGICLHSLYTLPGMKHVKSAAIGACILIGLSRAINLSVDINALDRVAIVGKDSPFSPILESLFLAFSIMLLLIAFYFAVRSVSRARIQLQDEHSQLFKETSERKLAEESMQYNEEYLRSLIENVSDVITEISHDGEILYSSPSTEHTFGFTPEEAVGTLYIKYIHPDDIGMVVGDPVFQVDHPATLPTVEWRMLHKSGAWRLIENKSIRILNSRNELRTIITSRDITDARKAEEDKEVLENQLRQAQRMESVGQLAGGVAHDFNNILQVIHGYTEMELRLAPNDSRRHHRLSEVATAADRAIVLTRQLLAFGRRQVMELHNIDVNLLIKDLFAMLDRLIPENIELSLKSSTSSLMVYADSGQLEQVLTNLVVNSRDAMPDGGSILIETKMEVLDSDFCATHDWAKPGEYVSFVLSDTGYGMDKDTLEHMFEPFYTTKEIGQGSGLGLATVYGIVKQHNGHVEVSSQIDQGTTFQIYIPKSPMMTQNTTDEVELSAVGGTETILVAEDEISVREWVETVLTDAGYTVLLARDGEEAVELFFDHQNEIDLAVLDVVMPGKNGREVFESIKVVHPDFRVIFASGYSTAGAHTAFVLDEGLKMLQKPYSHSELLGAVRAGLDAQSESLNR